MGKTHAGIVNKHVLLRTADRQVAFCKDIKGPFRTIAPVVAPGSQYEGESIRLGTQKRALCAGV
jgi:hypothetical protein